MQMAKIIFIMARTTTVLFPRMSLLLKELGENIRLARLRRRITAEMVAERAGMTRTTLRAKERGSAGVTIGAYANVLMTLGLERDLALIAQNDPLGRKLQDAGLPIRSRAPKKKSAEKIK